MNEPQMPPSISNNEILQLYTFLKSIPEPSEKIKDAIAYLEEQIHTMVTGIQVRKIQ